ncbi:MAG: DUF948 domain-containing protein [Acidobacteriota bacterium]
MPLTLNQILLLILTLAAVVVTVYLVRFLGQLRRTAVEGEKTMLEVRRLAQNLNELDAIIKKKLNDLGEVMEASKKTAVHLSEASLLLTTRFLKPASRYWPLLYPLIMFFWKKFGKRREKKNGG